MTFNWELGIGTIIQVASTIAAFLLALVMFKTKIELLLTNHAELMRSFATRFAKHEENDDHRFHEIHNSITALVGSVQRLVGQNEYFRRGEERRGDDDRRRLT